MDKLMRFLGTRFRGQGSGKRRARLRSRTASGFTLLETTFAMAILGIGILGVAGSQLTSMKLSRDSRAQTYAIYLAQQQMETFLRMSSADLDDVLAAPTYPNDPAGHIDPDPNDDRVTTYGRSWEILPDDPEPGMYKVTVIIAFTDRMGRPRTERLQSLLAEF